MADSFYTTYLRESRLWAIQRCLEFVFKKEGRTRIAYPRAIDPVTESAMYRGISDDAPVWAVALRLSPGGWTILKTLTPELLVDVPRGGGDSRLAELTYQLGCHGLSVNFWDCVFRVVESNSLGNTVHSGVSTIRDLDFNFEMALDDEARPAGDESDARGIDQGQEHVFVLRPEFNQLIERDPCGSPFAESIGQYLTGFPYEVQDDNLLYNHMIRGVVDDLDGWTCLYFVDNKINLCLYSDTEIDD